MIDNDKIYIKYAQDVLSGDIIACRYIKMACQRFLDWFSRDDIYFDYDTVDKRIRFIHKIKHYKDKHAGKPFDLLPFQQWIVANIFGWRNADDGTRVVQNVFCFMNRKSGKTALAAAICLACVLETPGAEIDLVANSKKQADIAFMHCKNFSESLDPKKNVFGRFRETVTVPKNKGVIQVLAADSMGMDGYGATCFVVDEFAAAKTWDVYNIMKSSQGAVENPLGIIITSANFLLDGFPCYEYRKTCIDILKGTIDDDSTFIALYELDDDDDYHDESVWDKVCPSLGHTVSLKYMRERVKEADIQPSKKVDVLTKQFNRFVSSNNCWIDSSVIEKSSTHIDLSQLKGEPCYGGLDLSSVGDLSCWTLMFPPNPDRSYYPDKYLFKTWIYVPKDNIEKSVNKANYQLWCNHDYVRTTSGNVIDYNEILGDILKEVVKYDLMCMAYDPYNATHFVVNAQNEGLVCEQFSQGLGHFNFPTKMFEILVHRGDVLIDENPCVRWSFGNVELKYDHNENVKPIKSGKIQSKKIDPVISMLESLGIYFEKNQDVFGESFTLNFND